MTSTEQAAQANAGRYELSHLRSLEAEAIHIIREVAAEFERPCCCSPAARTPSSCCISRSRRSGRAGCRSR